MAYGYAKGFVIEYVPRRRNKKKKDCHDCIHANLNYHENNCKIMPIVFSEDGYSYYKYCKHFNTGSGEKNNSASENSKKELPKGDVKTVNKKNKTKTIHHGKKVRINQSKPIISRANKENKFSDSNKLFHDVEKSNFIELWENKGQRNVCDCGGALDFSGNNEVCFHIDNKLVSVGVSGKVCKDCKKMFVVKEYLIKEISVL